MKKLIYALCIMMVFGLAACGGEVEKRESISSTQNDEKKGEETKQEDRKDNGETTPNGREEVKPQTASNINIDDENNYWIEINGKKFGLNSSVKDVLATGLTTEEGDMVISPDDSDTIDLYWDGDYLGLLYVRNDGNVDRAAIDCNFSGIIMSEDDDLKGFKLSTVGGITHGSTEQAVLNVFGECDDIYEGTYSKSYDYDAEDGKGFNFDIVEGKVTSIHIYKF